MTKYYLCCGEGPKREVSKEEWVRAERLAGFVPKGVSRHEKKYYEVCATGGFGDGNIHGTIENIKEDGNN